MSDVAAIAAAARRFCAACGSHDTTLRLAVQGTVAKVACRGCGATGGAQRRDTREEAIAAAVHDWNTRPPTLAPAEPVAPESSRGPRRSRRSTAPHSDDRDVLELVARMLVPGGYRVPVEGRSSRPGLQPSDIAAALGSMRGRLERDTAMAVATRAGAPEIARLSNRAYRRALVQVGRLRPCPLALEEGADRWRLRLVLYDAAYGLVWPEASVAAGEAARRVKMRKSSYLTVRRICSGVLQAALDDARRRFKRTLFAAS